MKVKVRLPSALRQHVGGSDDIVVTARSVHEAIQTACETVPALKKLLLDEGGSVRERFTFFVDMTRSPSSGGLGAAAPPDAFIRIVPAVGGGAVEGNTRVDITLTAQRAQMGEPFIWRLCRDFNVKVQIRKANIDEDFGWIAISLEGPLEEIQRATAWLHTTGLHVDPAQRSVGS